MRIERRHILRDEILALVDVRIVTAYRPDPDEWEAGFKRRKTR
jgi:hypothetical protein